MRGNEEASNGPDRIQKKKVKPIKVSIDNNNNNNDRMTMMVTNE